jgi:hypothetical protein
VINQKLKKEFFGDISGYLLKIFHFSDNLLGARATNIGHILGLGRA